MTTPTPTRTRTTRKRRPGETARSARRASATTNGSADEPAAVTALHRSVAEALEGYFDVLDGARTGDLYDLVMNEVERPLLAAVMGHVDDNQTRAAELLGLSRGTLHKKLKQHGLLGI